MSNHDSDRRGARDHIEREAKFALPDAAALDRIAAELRAGPPVEQWNVFFDTEARELRAAGHGLRLRLEWGRAEVTLKGPDSGRAGAPVRRELGGPVDPTAAEAIAAGVGSLAALPGPALDEVRRLTGGAPLREWVRFRNVRRTASVRIDGAACEACCDATTFADGHVDHELEVEVPEAALLAPAVSWARALCGRLGIPAVPQLAAKSARAARRARPA